MPQPKRQGSPKRSNPRQAAPRPAAYTSFNPWEAGNRYEESRAMDPKTTAVVLIEFQNDFTTPRGVFHDGVKDVMRSTNMLAHTVKVANAARAAGATVMHVAISFAEGYRELGHPYGILKDVADNQAFRKDTWGAAIVEVLKPQPDDIVIEGKRGLDAFASTNLDFILRHKGIRTVALAGFLTNVCVESTMRSAYERGFDVVTLKDCTATLSQAAQDAALAHSFGVFSHPMNHDEFLKRLAPRPSRKVPRSANGRDLLLGAMPCGPDSDTTH